MTKHSEISAANMSLAPTPEGGHTDTSVRCRLVLVLTGEQLAVFAKDAPRVLENALSGGDVSSVVLSQNTLDEAEFTELVRPCVEAVQQMNVAAIIAGDPRVAGRCGADGIQYGQDLEGVRDGVDRYAPKFMIGAGNIRSRHNALIIGEAQPDYIMFGKPGGDTQAPPLPRNLELGAWWSAMIEIPCLVMGGTAVDSVVEVSSTGAEFVCLGHAIFGPKESPIPVLEGNDTPASRVAKANELLDAQAPLLLEADEKRRDVRA
ncbi:thiamine phosphate synthase [Pseudahrensia aquimaris]|uniref:Thiamine phosphate synthase n=1 Tax=Pseudahrensia aquimaris TaxID=744461 RepID=A0ABW3FBR3_9HYPH